MANHKHEKGVENVLILQGGGSLGAFACGVFKGFAKKNMKFDIIAGTSIGGINGAIAAGSNNDRPEVDLENFWLDLAESSYNIIPDIFTFDFDYQKYQTKLKRSPAASLNAAFYGVPDFFIPRWLNFNISNLDGSQIEQYYQPPWKWTYIYDNSILSKTLEKYIDFKKLSPRSQQNNTNEGNSNINPRLIITAVDVLTAEPLIFDSYKKHIEMKHLLATIGYPQYGFPWVEVSDGTFAWDGSLLSNTPIREVMVASPSKNKNIFVVESYPKKIEKLPANMSEVMSRSKDLMFSDKTKSLQKMSRLITRHVNLIETLYDIFQDSDQSKIDKDKIDYINKEHSLLVDRYGAKILKLNRITKVVPETQYPLQNADFSVETIKELIRQGEKKAVEYLD
ncbi:MAG: patatin-like phospholipase family protein [Nitrososphaeraceae archaeon]|nr:patatin-like phospholipase family protein [Nitrososphaeraceae archaeon]MDW0167964.1 patatin-like phospholipase family protein [Nitrososphaeraceae archaeon]MDW0170880.1 patatin-like phospholipase family protein [Nitrososphaeraceae archaeon]MDW0172419.1 patatin-like phospholipase family protein [Nitrososphaeraceae archaeon]MDW0174710.1 patatin-like phospholipase family protein [Nitrososphaeraceae archaeon]